MADIDTTNTQLVGKRGDSLMVQSPRPIHTKQAAYRHAAWLVLMAEMLPDEFGQVDGAGDPYTFPAILEAVQNT